MFKIDKGVTIEGGWVERDPPEVVLESANRKEFEKKIIRETKAEVRQRPKSLETLSLWKPPDRRGCSTRTRSLTVNDGQQSAGWSFPRATK